MIPEIIKIIAIVLLIIFIVKTTKFIFKSIIFIVLLLFVLSFFYPSFPLEHVKESFKLGVKEKVAEKMEESKEIAECKLKQGIWQTNSKGNKFCNLPTQDQNKTCFNSDECEGLCIADNETTGHCQDYNYIKGCFKILTNQTKDKQEEICFD